jgi:hypothetical protein
MSKGPGRVERRIADIFANAARLQTFTPEELAQLVYGVDVVEKKHRVAVLRATRNVLPSDWQETQWYASAGGLAKLLFHHSSHYPRRRSRVPGTIPSSPRGASQRGTEREFLK